MDSSSLGLHQMDDAILGYLWDLNPELIYAREFCGTSGTGEETNEAMNTSDQSKTS